MGVVNPILPTPGEPRGTEETDVRNALIMLLDEFNGNIEVSNLAEGLRNLFAPVGSIIATARATADAGYLLCDGAAVSRASYSALFNAIGTSQGAGDGLSTFNVPDLKGRVPIGTGTAVGANGATAHGIGQKDGHETHTLTLAQAPAHAHLSAAGVGLLADAVSFQGYQLPAGSSGRQVVGGGTDTVGGGQAHTNMQPYTALNFQIKT